MPKPLAEVRAEHLVGIRELARSAGISHKTLINIERGRQVPQFRTIRAITTALGVEAKEISEFVAVMEQAGKAAALNRTGPRPMHVPAPVS